MILAGDIGGTHARFALYESDGVRRIRIGEVDSKDHTSLESAARAFLAQGERREHVHRATFAIAGPVVDGRVKTTNLPWIVDARKLSRALEIPKVALVNDLVGHGLGALRVSRTKLVSLQNGMPKRAGENISVIAAGTGLGEAILVWDGKRHVPCGTEGSHVDFAPRTKVEEELRDHLAITFGHVSYERIASGRGIGATYDFFVRKKRVRETKTNERALAESPDRNALVAQLAMEKKSRAAALAIDLVLSVYGAEAGNLALKSLSVGGVLVCGGISAKLVPMLRKGPFLRAFIDKGRMSRLVRAMPVCVVLDSRVGLAGSAYHAAHLID